MEVSTVLSARSLVSCGIALAMSACGQDQQKGPPPPPTVTVTEVTERDVPLYVEFAGTLDANVNAEARARVAGVLVAQNYREGSLVKAGQCLFTIDPLPFRAALLQAKGSLEQARAALEKANADIERYRPLVAKRAATKEQLDNAIAARHTAEGQVEAAKGALQQAELNLGYTQVLSPVDGIADIAQVRVGNLVGQGSPTLLTTGVVRRSDPLRLPDQRGPLSGVRRSHQAALRAFARAGAGVERLHHEARARARRRAALPHTSGTSRSSGGAPIPRPATLTGQAFFPNPDMLLRPGQYGRARFQNVIPHAKVIPQRAVRELQGEKQVAVVSPDNHVEVRSVKVGPTTGGFVIIEDGLKTGERVVVDGVQKVKAGQPVAVTPADTSTLQHHERAVRRPRRNYPRRNHPRRRRRRSEVRRPWGGTSSRVPSWRSSSRSSPCSWAASLRRACPIAQYPNIIPPQIQVQTVFTGADAVTIEQSVATPIEQQVTASTTCSTCSRSTRTTAR